MKVMTIIVILLVLVAGWFVVLPVVAPTVTEKTIERDASVSMGDSFAIMNQSELALTMYDHALIMNASDTAILKKKAEMLLKTGQITQAETIYQQVLTQDRNDTAALMRAGDGQVRLGDLNGALTYYNEALAVNPADSKILLKKGDTYLLMSAQETQKLQVAAQAMAKQPGTAGYEPVSAVSVESQQSYQNAMASYQKAMEIDPKLSVVISAKVLMATQNQVASYQSLLNNF